MVDIDYEFAFGNGELFLNNWEKSFPNIVAFLQKDGHIKDRAAKALLAKSVKDNCDENSIGNFKNMTRKQLYDTMQECPEKNTDDTMVFLEKKNRALEMF
ncbi:hypothetical protein JTB14_004305 [Gonioctena quinquepunctata]|nr:hypothetical protein JTB14_004305 [Gonioctena quinquepunctata]